MIQETALLLVTSLVFALGFIWLRQPTLLGYIAAGVLLGPSFVKLIEYPMFIEILGSFGMLMLLFLVGLELDIREFRKVWHIALITLFAQIITSLLIAFSLGFIFLWSLEKVLLIASLLMLSSTAIAVTLLEEMKKLNTEKGALTISILIAQDLALVPIILILRGFSQKAMFHEIAIKLFVAIGFLALLMMYLGNNSKKNGLKPLKKIFQGNNETMTLAGITVCFCCASISAFLGLSYPYGAFLGGLVLGSFGNRKEIIQVAMPISSMLVMMFFLSIGANINVDFLIKNWITIITISLAITVFKTIINYLILRSLGCGHKKSAFVGIMLGQSSEFSFSLIVLSFQAGTLSLDSKNMLDSLIIFSLTFGSIWPVISRNLFKKWF